MLHPNERYNFPYGTSTASLASGQSYFLYAVGSGSSLLNPLQSPNSSSPVTYERQQQILAQSLKQVPAPPPFHLFAEKPVTPPDDTIQTGLTPVAFNLESKVLSQAVLVTRAAENQVALVDPVTQLPIKTIEVGQTPISSVWPEQGYLAYVANFGDGSLSVIDLNQGAVVKTVALGINPTQIKLSKDQKSILIYNGGKKPCLQFNIQTFQVSRPVQKAQAHKESSPAKLMKSKATSNPQANTINNQVRPDREASFTDQARQHQSQALNRSINRLVENYFLNTGHESCSA